MAANARLLELRARLRRLAVDQKRVGEAGRVFHLGSFSAVSRAWLRVTA